MKRNVPKLRFKGFDDEWKEKKLGETVEFYDNLRKPIKEGERKTGKYPYYGATGVIDYIDDYIFEGQYLLLGEDGANIVTRNAPLVYKTQGQFWVNNHAHIFKTKDNYDIDYMKQCLEIINYVPYNTGTAQPKLNIENVKKIQVKCPSLQEQEKIANFLTKVDSLIEEQDGKVKDLELYKKGMMQKIFSQEIRFKDDNGCEYPEWEKIKIENCFNVTAGGDIAKEHVSKELNGKFKYPIYSNSLISKGLYGYSDTYKVRGETITVTGRGSIGVATARYTEYFPIVRLLVLRPTVVCNIKFFEEAINNTKVFIESTGVPQLTAPQLSNIKINTPCLEEQTKIANFLSNIDSIIEQENNKLQDLRQWKKGLLQQMFV